MDWIERYIQYITAVRRYSPRTKQIYSDILDRYVAFYSSYCGSPEGEAEVSAAGGAAADQKKVSAAPEGASDTGIADALHPQILRNYIVYLLDDEGVSPRTVNLHLSVISGFSRFLMREGVIETNPVKLAGRPRTGQRLPDFFRKDLIGKYMADTAHYVSEDALAMLEDRDKVAEDYYEGMRKRLIIKLLYDTGIRRAELISLTLGSVDFGRSVLRVRGKGDKMREIPMIGSLCNEISLYLKASVLMRGPEGSVDDPLIRAKSGKRLYPMAVERVVNGEMKRYGATGKASPHVLRHTIATELLDDGADLNSIKEFLGHSSLAATQVYTHNSIEKLKKVYTNAHPRAKRGG